jgi:hypothetical protein
MLADHIAWAFVPTFSPLGFVMHALGRITAPCMCFFLAEGYLHTHDIRRYLLRLGVFALLSWPCFTYFEMGPGTVALKPGMIWSLFFSLLAVLACDRLPNLPLKVLAAAGCMLATTVGDWPVYSVLFTLIFWKWHGNFRRQALYFSAAALFTAVSLAARSSAGVHMLLYFVMQLSVLLALLPLSRYSGKRGGEKHPAFHKWFFYVFYPAHLLVLGFLRYSVFT